MTNRKEPTLLDQVMAAMERHLQPEFEQARAEILADGNAGWTMMAKRAIELRCASTERPSPPAAKIEAALRAVPNRHDGPHEFGEDFGYGDICCCGPDEIGPDFPAMARAVVALMEGKG